MLKINKEDCLRIDISLGKIPLQSIDIPIYKTIFVPNNMYEKMTMLQWRKAAIVSALLENNLNGRKAARQLKIGERSIYRLIKSMEIDLQALKDSPRLELPDNTEKTIE